MISPKNIIGPNFGNGDITTFIFDGSELTLSLPIIPNNRNTIDKTSSLTDFRNVVTHEWDTNDQGRPCFQLASQLWCFEDAKTLDDVAECELYIGLVEATDSHRKESTLLSTSDFESLMLAWHSYSFTHHEKKYAEDSSWPALANRYHGRAIKKDPVSWFVVQLALTSQSKPVHLVMIPINSRFVLMAYIQIESLHYAGRTNPYSNELLKQFELDLFEDFLSHIKVDYSSETIAQIELLNSKTPA